MTPITRITPEQGAAHLERRFHWRIQGVRRQLQARRGRSIRCVVGSAPRFENTLDVRSHPIASLSTWDPGHKELVIAGIAVTYRGHDGKRHGVGVERPTSCTPAHASASPSSGMGRDDLGPLGWTAREQSRRSLCREFP